MHNQGHEAHLERIELEHRWQSLWQLYLMLEDVLTWWKRQDLSDHSCVSHLETKRSEIASELQAAFPQRWANETSQPNNEWHDTLKSCSPSHPQHAKQLASLIRQLQAHWRIACIKDRLTVASTASNAAQELSQATAE